MIGLPRIRFAHTKRTPRRSHSFLVLWIPFPFRGFVFPRIRISINLNSLELWKSVRKGGAQTEDRGKNESPHNSSGTQEQGPASDEGTSNQFSYQTHLTSIFVP